MIGKRFLRVGFAVVPALLLALGIGIRLSFLASDRIASGIKIADIDLGGLGRAQAAEQLGAWTHRRSSDTLTFVAEGRKWTGTLYDVGVVPDAKRMLERAYSQGREGNVLERIWDGLVPMRLTVLYRYDNDKIEDIRQKISAAVASPAKDARLSFADGTRTIIPDSIGTTIDFTHALESIRSAVESGGATVPLEIVPDKPKVTSADLEGVDTLLASYSTRYPAWRKDRAHNVWLAASGIDGGLVRPGEVFSYNKAVGPRVKENGFRDAMIYVRGKIIPGTGGGVCQVSSTLYNAALLADLDIVERNHHSMRVPYVPMGRDATVAWGLLDLKLRNSASAPIYISAKAGRSRLTVAIYGAWMDKKNVKIVTTKPEPVEQKDGKQSYAVTVYRIVGADGAPTVTRKISRDRYDPAPPQDLPRPNVGKKEPERDNPKA